MPDPKVVLDGDKMRRALTRITHEIAENAGAPEQVALVGIHRRGAVLAARLHRMLAELHDIDVPLGDLDIAFYRDDVTLRGGAPVVHATHLDFDIDGLTILIVDDVLFTGRTVRAAIDALFDYGRPARVQLAVLADRGHRELPIRPDYVGKNLPTAHSERVWVRVTEIDGDDSVSIGEQPHEVLGRQDADRLLQSGGPDAPEVSAR
jgi:pyrimidine operon attenuation protein/uracil phosphoribosyltransferase